MRASTPIFTLCVAVCLALPVTAAAELLVNEAADRRPQLTNTAGDWPGLRVEALGFDNVPTFRLDKPRKPSSRLRYAAAESREKSSADLALLFPRKRFDEWTREQPDLRTWPGGGLVFEGESAVKNPAALASLLTTGTKYTKFTLPEADDTRTVVGYLLPSYPQQMAGEGVNRYERSGEVSDAKEINDLIAKEQASIATAVGAAHWAEYMNKQRGNLTVWEARLLNDLLTSDVLIVHENDDGVREFIPNHLSRAKVIITVSRPSEELAPGVAEYIFAKTEVLANSALRASVENLFENLSMEQRDDLETKWGNVAAKEWYAHAASGLWSQVVNSESSLTDLGPTYSGWDGLGGTLAAARLAELGGRMVDASVNGTKIRIEPEALRMMFKNGLKVSDGWLVNTDNKGYDLQTKNTAVSIFSDPSNREERLTIQTTDSNGLTDYTVALNDLDIWERNAIPGSEHHLVIAVSPNTELLLEKIGLEVQAGTGYLTNTDTGAVFWNMLDDPNVRTVWFTVDPENPSNVVAHVTDQDGSGKTLVIRPNTGTIGATIGAKNFWKKDEKPY